VPFLAAVVAAPLAVVLGASWSFLTALFAPSRHGEPVWTPRRRRCIPPLLVFVVVMTLGAVHVVPEWGMQIDEERDFFLSALCADGKGCPLVGNEMNQLRIKLGPLNRYLLTLCQLVTPDPRFALWMILALHAFGAAWLARTGDRLLGFPFGLIAGLLFGLNLVLLDVIGAASNGAWSSVFQVGAVVGTVQWMRGEARGLIVAVTCLTAACQLHGTNLALVPPFLLAAAYWRPPMPRRSVLWCVTVVAAMYSSWFVYQWQTWGSDFSMMSTSWIVSQGPGLIHRLFRVTRPLNGMLLAPVALAGALALAVGRMVQPSDRRAARMVPLFLSLPLAAALLAGGNWNDRYGAPMVAPGALAGAAGLYLLASWLPGGRQRMRRYGLTMAGVGLAFVVGMAILEGSVNRGPVMAGRSRTQLGLAEQIEAVRVLGTHGFGAADLESQVHGVAWNRWGGGQVYLAEWLIGVSGQAAPEDRVTIVECERVDAKFASWQHRLTSSRRLPRLLAGYRSQLAPVRVEFIGGGGMFWSSDRAVPFYSQMLHGGDAQMRALFDPRLAYPPEFADLQARWPNDQALEIRLSTTLAPGHDDRVIALTYDGGLNATVTFAGAVQQPFEAVTSLGEIVLERYLVKAAERVGSVVIEAVIDVPAGVSVPRRFDLYEEPPCAID
jgi:hypothetical protein